MVDLFREVEEDVQRDRMLALWRRWRWHVIGAAVALVAGTAAAVGWQEYRDSAAADRGARFLAAMRLADGEEWEASARAFAQFAEAESGVHAALARLRQAAMLVRAGDRSGALAAYNALIDSDADPVFADLARVLASQHLIDRGETRAAERRLEPVAEGAGPWRFLARELVAVAALQDGRLTEARQKFEALREEADAPRGVRERAGRLTAALGGES